MKSDNFISKHKILLVSVGILAVLLAALIVAMCLRPGGGDSTEPFLFGWLSDILDTGQTTDPSGADSTTGTDSEDSTSAGEGADSTGPNSTGPGTVGPGSTAESTGPGSTTKPAEEKITYDRISMFSGKFVEDGSDVYVENVAAVLVTNQTDQFLDLATMTFDVGGKTATFIITGLPAGKSAWVLESTGMTVTDDAVFKYRGCATSFRDDAVSTAEELTIETGDSLLRVVNNTDKTLENVCVYYKILHTDGNYFGGVAYMVAFDKLEPGETVEEIAGHYFEGEAEIVRIGWQEATADEAS